MRNLAKIARDLAQNMKEGAAALEEAATILEQSSVVRVAERLGMLAGSATLASPAPVRPGPVGPVEPAPEAPVAGSLQAMYQNLGALLDDARRLNYQYVITVDDVAQWPGFGPPNRYRTNADGSVSAK